MIVQPEVRCVEFVADVTDWMEGALTPDERSLIEEHLTICPHCVTYVDQIRGAVRVLRSTAPDDAPRALRDAVLAALREARS